MPASRFPTVAFSLDQLQLKEPPEILVWDEPYLLAGSQTQTPSVLIYDLASI